MNIMDKIISTVIFGSVAVVAFIGFVVWIVVYWVKMFVLTIWIAIQTGSLRIADLIGCKILAKLKTWKVKK